ncbi:MAG: glutamine synthetase type III, partial [Spirochaetota bacterium]
FTAIKERVIEFMKDLDEELWKLGIPAKTRHNEVAPGQHEMAPVFTTTNVATDQNQLMMETMKKVAARHDRACLLHEKPFAGVNGSGKHNNWSIGTDTGRLLTDPGIAPHENMEFQLILAIIIRAVDEHADALRSAAANPGNDHRLGANEAPPAIISIYLGDQLANLVDQILEKGEATGCINCKEMVLGASSLPSFAKDNSDRNRTSPFAFTGNKFEFRMVPSSASIAGPNFVLNTAVADVMQDVADRLEKASDVKAEVKNIIKEYITSHSRVIYNGDNYTEEWVKEAEKRGLPHSRNLVDAKKALIAAHNVKMFERQNVLTERDCHARYEILLEHYINTINIEALTALEMAKRDLLPAIIRFITELADSINTVKETGVGAVVDAQTELLKEISALAASARKKVVTLDSALAKALSLDDIEEKAVSYRDDVFTGMNDLRSDFDRLEMLVDAEYWPIPTYADILFSVR